jgi:hypothetical protein
MENVPLLVVVRGVRDERLWLGRPWKEMKLEREQAGQSEFECCGGSVFRRGEAKTIQMRGNE